MSTLNKSSIEVLNDIGLCQEKGEALFKQNCPHCYSEKVKIHSHYQTKGNGDRSQVHHLFKSGANLSARFQYLPPPLHLDEQTIERQKERHHHYSNHHSLQSDSGLLQET